MNSLRVRGLNQANISAPGPVVYWMSRDQRVHSNWALVHAHNLSRESGRPLVVIFCLRPSFMHATERTVSFLLGGLEQVEKSLRALNISFHLLLGDPVEQILKFVDQVQVSAIVTDFNPLNWSRKWKQSLATQLNVPFYEVDAHNIVPCWYASPKQEFGAYTLRPKINKFLPVFLDKFPKLKPQPPSIQTAQVDWSLVERTVKIDRSVPKIDWLLPGENHASRILVDFVSTKLSSYSSDRNDPTLDAQSNLSPYLHFGHISAQEVAIAVTNSAADQVSKEAFLEELVNRRELSDNYCFYNSNYDNPGGFPSWAQKSLSDHSTDKREFLYSLEELETAKTHDPLWNAAQKQMLVKGKMHGYMRMYWAKKILEWTPSVSTAQKFAIHLNDKYFLDGRDPNGYTGIAWSLGGVHDRPWFDRPIFGKIRYMNFSGASKKFDTKKFIALKS